MSADEIRRLVRIYSAKEKDLKDQLDRFRDAEMTPNLENISIARKDAIMTIKALLDYAETVERMEKLNARLLKMLDKRNPEWSLDGHAEASMLQDFLNFIAKGETK